MAKSFSNSVALNFISSAQQKETQQAAETQASTQKTTNEEKKIVTKVKTSKTPKSKVKESKTTAKTVKKENHTKQEKPTPQTPDLPMLNLNIPVVERKSTRVQLLIKPSLVEKLKAIAKAKNTSVNDLVNVILETVLK